MNHYLLVVDDIVVELPDGQEGAGGFQLELITFEILAAERLRLMGFDNRLIIDCFANVVNILIWLFSSNDRFRSGKYDSNYLEKESIHCRKHIAMTKAI